MKSDPPNNALRTALEHPFITTLAALGTAATLFGLGYTMGGSPNTPFVPTSETVPDSPQVLEGTLYGRISVDGRAPTTDELADLDVTIEHCDDQTTQGQAEVDLTGEYEVADLQIEPSGTCLRPVVTFRGRSFPGTTVQLDSTADSDRLEVQNLSLLPPACEDPAGTLAIRFVESGVLATTTRAEAAQIAINEIREAGGALGPVLYERTSIINDPPTEDQVAELLGECVDAVVTHLGSSTSLSILPSVTGAGVIQFSPNSTSPRLTAEDVDSLFFRTAPSDEIQGRVLARDMAAQGRSSVAVFYRDDEYGSDLKQAFEENFEGGDERRRVVAEQPLPMSGVLDLDQVSSSIVGADSALIIGYDAQSARVIEQMSELGFNTGLTWLVDGNAKVAGELSEPSILAGARQTVPGAELSGQALSSLRQRLAVPAGRPLDSFAAQTYDAVIILALAAAASDTKVPLSIAEQINGVTRDGTKCTRYSVCLQLIEDAVNIDYDGVGGPYDFTDFGEPSLALYRIDVYGPDGLPDPQSGTQGQPETLCLLCRTNEPDLRVTFLDDDSSLDENDFARLDQVSEIIRSSGASLVVIEGYASQTGTAEDNQVLSTQRAETVYNYLEELDLGPRLEFVGMGETDKFIENRTVLFREG